MALGTTIPHAATTVGGGRRRRHGVVMVPSPESGIGNVVWFVLCGWWLAILHLIGGVILCVTIIGIPLGLANFKLIPVSLLPMGREIISVEQARAMGLAGG